MSLIQRYLAYQFARPRGLAGRWIFGSWLDRVNQGMNALALDLLRVQPVDRILEVGFGGGALFASILDRNPAEAIGVDPSKQMVARGRRRFRGAIARGRAEISLGPVEKLPVESRLIDKACSLNTIYFWTDPEAGMRELARVIRPGGTLILGFEAPETLRAWPGHRYGFTVYEPAEVVRLAEEAGFGNAEIHEGLEPKFGKIYCVKAERL
ncbi:MAG TPA: class I SAM-dependent methyltransferase [Allosphingosinicella sp.]|uniref:class I SAM-dependent methyltransferase n=1 Tax=Allosphingosinicella sp. TaxID=2823234 RepID=UPI002EDB4667